MKRTPLKRGTKQLKRSGFKSTGILTPKKAKTPLKKPKTAPKRRRRDPNSITSLKKKLWKLFSKFIRERDAYVCFTCGKHATGSGMHAGHFITGATCPKSLFFDETNVHAQCYHCNINLSGNWVLYEAHMVTKYGKPHVEKLKHNRTLLMGEKKDTQWHLDKIKHYESLL